jgi:hypothetical protein
MPPPVGKVPQSKADIRAFKDYWTRLISNRPGVIDNCNFYREVDAYLGPWGKRGYPIGYGLFYCQLFGSNEELNKDLVSREWLQRTRILLQESLRDFMVREYAAGRLPRLTESRLRKAAFDSHPDCYLQGGLSRVVLRSPWLIPVIMAVPAKEFHPQAESSGATYWQALVTGVSAAGEVSAEVLIPSLNEGEMDALALYQMPTLLEDLGKRLQEGEFDHLPTLEMILRALQMRRYPTVELRLQAEKVIDVAKDRVAIVQNIYRDIESSSPHAAPEIRSVLSNLCRGSFYACPAQMHETISALPDRIQAIPSNGGALRTPGPVGK